VWRRRAVAYLDTVDWDLDIWVQPDRTWTWKDEDLFVERLAHADAYWVDDEPRVRRAGAAVVALVEAGAFPFDGTWCDFSEPTSERGTSGAEANGGHRTTRSRSARLSRSPPSSVQTTMSSIRAPCRPGR
jgi:hypothetical protein